MREPRRKLAGVLALAAIVASLAIIRSLERRTETASEFGPSVLEPPERPQDVLAGVTAEQDEKAVRSALDVADEHPVAEAEIVEDREADEVERQPTLIVRLVSSSGRVIEGYGAQLSAQRPGHEAGMAYRPGGIRELHLAPGPWTLKASAPAHEDHVRVVNVADVVEPATLDLVLEARPALRIVVLTPDGEPLSRKLARSMRVPRAVATHERPERFLDEVLSQDLRDACGTCLDAHYAGLDERCVGLLELRCDLPVWINLVIGIDVLESRRLEQLVDELVFEVDPALLPSLYPTVTVRVVDAGTGEALAPSARIQFGYWSGAVATGASTGEAKGMFRFSGVPGPSWLELELEGFETVRMELVVPRVPEHDLGTVAMTPARMGEVLLDVDLPDGVEASVVQVAPFVGFNEPASFRTMRPHDVREGETRIALTAGRWVVWGRTEVAGRWYGTGLHLLDLSAGYQRASLAFHPLVPIELRAADRRMVTVFQQTDGLRVVESLVAEPGEPARLQVVPGTYRVVAIDRAGGERTTALVVGSQGATVDLP